MKMKFFLTFFLFLLPVLEGGAQENAKITGALDDVLPSELILEPVESVESNEPVEERHSIVVPEKLPEKLPEPVLEAQKLPISEDSVTHEVGPNEKMTVVPPPTPRKIETKIETKTESNELPVLRQNPAQSNVQNPVQNIVPFNPSSKLASDSAPILDPAAALDALFRRYNFPYAFIHVNVMSENAESRQFGETVQLDLPIVVSFDTEGLALFQKEMKTLLNKITLSEPKEISLPAQEMAKNWGRRNIFFSVNVGGDAYTVYELPESCRPVLAQYAALLPVAEVSFFDENQNVLAQHFFPLLYRGIVKAYPINLLAVYQSDYQTIRIYPHQTESFEAFIQAQGASFVIPKRFPLVSAVTASAEFLGKNAKYFFLESSFRQAERLTEIPFMTHITVSTDLFHQIRFMKSQIETDAPGETTLLNEAFDGTEAETLEGTDVPQTVQIPQPTQTPQTRRSARASKKMESKPSVIENSTDSISSSMEPSELEATVRKTIQAQKSIVMSFYGEKEMNVTLSAADVSRLAAAFHISRLEKTQVFDDTPELDLASLGWLEIRPGTSIMFLFPEGASEESAPTLNSRAALWISGGDGKLMLVYCDLDDSFIEILKQALTAEK